jgi:hypothetical protein
VLFVRGRIIEGAGIREVVDGDAFGRLSFGKGRTVGALGVTGSSVSSSEGGEGVEGASGGVMDGLEGDGMDGTKVEFVDWI